MRIFFDVDTQVDFMDRGRPMYVPGAESIKRNLARLTLYAKDCFIPVAGSIDHHFGTELYKGRESPELARWNGPFPDHCMDGTEGMQKIEETALVTPAHDGFKRTDNGIYIPNTLDGSVNTMQLLTGMHQIRYSLIAAHMPKRGMYFEKQDIDVFTNPAFAAFLDMANVTEAVVYGVATEYCVKKPVIGMQKRGIQCYVVEDAIKGIDPAAAEKALEEMMEAGAIIVDTKSVINGEDLKSKKLEQLLV